MNLILLRRQDVFEREIGGRKEDEEATLTEETINLRDEENDGEKKRGEDEQDNAGEQTKKKNVSYMAYIQEKNARLHCLTVLKVQVRMTRRAEVEEVFVFFLLFLLSFLHTNVSLSFFKPSFQHLAPPRDCWIRAACLSRHIWLV